jgi:hypothetical protein
MIRADQIPPEVVEAAAKELAYTNGWRNQQGIEVCKPVVKDIIAAALSAWPEGFTDTLEVRQTIILPLPQEARDE